MRSHRGSRYVAVLIVLSGCWLLTGCQDDSTTALSYLAVNHTHKSIVDIAINNQGGVLNAPAMGGGGGEVCCVEVPKKWHPGLTVTISWENDGDWLLDKKGQPVIRDGIKVYVPAQRKTRTVMIPKYQNKDVEHVDIHFLPHDQVLVKLSDIYPEHRDYQPAYPHSIPEASE